MTTDPRKTVFAQLTSHLPIRRLHTLVKRYCGRYKVKAFFGISENVVRIQVWTALSAYLLLEIVKQRLCLPQELHEMTQTLRLHLFEKMPVLSMFFEQPPQNNSTCPYSKSLGIFPDHSLPRVKIHRALQIAFL